MSDGYATTETELPYFDLVARMILHHSSQPLFTGTWHPLRRRTHQQERGADLELSAVMAYDSAQDGRVQQSAIEKCSVGLGYTHAVAEVSGEETGGESCIYAIFELEGQARLQKSSADKRVSAC